MSATKLDNQIGKALVDFSANGAFPEEEAISAAYVTSTLLPTVLGALGEARTELETEIRHISSDSASDVDDWIRNAKAIHDNIEKSRKLASSIVRQAEADEDRLEGLQHQENYVGFLSKEVYYNTQLLSCLKAIQEANDMLSRLEVQASEHNIVDALHTLADTFTSIAKIPLEKSTRAVRLLDNRASGLREHFREQLLNVWHNLVHVEQENGVFSFTVQEKLPNEPTTLSDAVVAFQSFKELDAISKKLWDNLDAVIFRRRTDIGAGSPPKLEIAENTLSLGSGTTDRTIKTLFTDLEAVIKFLNQRLPQEIVDPLSRRMMPILCSRILEDWLDTAVPASLDAMVDYQKALAQVGDFATVLDSMNWPGGDSLHDWVSNAPKIWLNKRRETALDWTRNQLSLGIGEPQFAERKETRMIARDDGHHIATTGNTVHDDWDAAWDGDEPEPEPAQNGHTKNRSSFEEELRMSQVSSPGPADEEDNEDDAADAWGWGDDDATADDTAEQVASAEQNQPQALERRISPETREMTISEKYWTSSLPQPVFNTVVQIYNDGAQLTKPESQHIPVTPSAPGLFALPTLILAMYRAISPYYYTNYPGGNMYLYNDAIWLAEKLKDFITSWNAREDLSPRAYGMVRLDSEFKVLESFGKRAYTNELIAQRTIINDLLNGAQNFFQQPPSTLSSAILPVLSHIRTQAHLFTTILPYSASSSATGSLVNTLASKLITDIFDLSDISVDDAERIATIISSVESLDDLFLPKQSPTSPSPSTSKSPSDPGEQEIPLTPQFAPLWLKLKFLSEVLQSNLKDVRYLWFESDLSLYFTADEVVELIGLSFEMNAQVRGVVREIRERRDPRGVGVSAAG
ncbi:centromere/kinetochore protein-like protein zw10 [Mollisia scopiformis]|uniref:Centromere/kinetochore protein-like protein zw10 n=1 Tax=Mollisia scopiformis TaxID=149040 RepID=A0A132B5S0_MOLSC|nr:centromere/kinetochore protein-like protein zw10 [Mollisia scopiformis]KUJ07758.1 centromere/kinetochore protein-like protein zw10 [Mollisia scopiformis]